MATDPTGAPWPTYSELQGRTPPGSSWGVFTHDPGRGAANFAGPAEVAAAAATVTRGAVFNLDYPLDAFDPPMSRARRAPRHEITAAHAEARDDVLHEFFPQASSQLDGLRHRRASGYGFYDGVPDEAIRPGTPELGVQLWAEKPIAGRALLLDVAGLLAAQGRPVDHREGPALDAELLDQTCAHQQVDVRPGDIVLVHTGWARWFREAPSGIRDEVRSGRRATGFRQKRSLAQWIWDHRVSVFATDTFAVEVLPVAPDSDYIDTAPEDAGMMHQELIAKLGIPLGELWNLEDLLADSQATGRWDALCVIKPLNLVGGVGSPPNATALR